MPHIVAKQRHFVTSLFNLSSRQVIDGQNLGSGGGINSSANGLAVCAEGSAEKNFDDQLHDIEEVLVERSDFQFRFASSDGRRNSSSALIQRRYSWRGYKCSDRIEPAHEAHQVTLQACRDETVVGTLTVCFDSDKGLAADGLYQGEIDAYRNAGASVCELTRLAVDPDHGSKEVLGALFHLAYIQVGVLRGVTDVFIEVNPRHVAFYQRMLNFRQVGECRVCPRVEAPAVLLHVQVAYVTEQIALHGGHRGDGTRSLYPYFFSVAEERGLARRLSGTGRRRGVAPSRTRVKDMGSRRAPRANQT